MSRKRYKSRVKKDQVDIEVEVEMDRTDESEVDILKKRIFSLEISLKLECLKTKIFQSIIEQKTDLKIPKDIIDYKDGVININTYNLDGKMPVIVHNFIKDMRAVPQNEYEMDKSVSPDIQRKTRFRTVKNEIELSEEKGIEQLVQTIDATQKTIESKRDLLKPEKMTKMHGPKDLEECFKNITETKSYTAPLKNMLKKRLEIMNSLSMEEYKKLINENITMVDKIFVAKGYNIAKRMSIISKGLSPFETRLVSYGKYDKPIEFDDRQKIKVYFEISSLYPQRYVPFDKDEVSKRFFNYSIALFTVKECIDIFLFNVYQFYNIIYIPYKKSEDSDPYSFYILKKIEDTKRYWNLDSRLEEVTISFSTNIKAYCITLFRHIYFNIFQDNVYRANYSSVSSVAEYECGQLVQNIMTLSDFMKTNSIIRASVKEKATYNPTDKDKVNYSQNDKMQKKRFLEEDREAIEESYYSSIYQMFDGIKKDDVFEIFNNLQHI